MNTDYFVTTGHPLIGATVYALNRTHGLAPSRPAGSHETVVAVNTWNGAVITDHNHYYMNGDYGIYSYRH